MIKKEIVVKLQVSFDMDDLDKALSTAAQIVDFVDILEVGTVLIFHYGIHAISAFRKQFPNKTILADAKIIDRSNDAINLFAHSGADWVTVMAGTSKNVIHGACTAAHEANKKVMLDLLDAPSLGQSALEAKNLGANALLFHHAYDDTETLVFLDQWEMLRGNTTLPIFVSGKITRTIIHKIMSVKPDGLIIGPAITDAEDPVQEAKFFYELCSEKTTQEPN